MINLNEALKVRKIGKNPFDFFQMHKIPNGTFVSFGYFNDHAISFGPKTKKLINQANDEQLINYLTGDKLNSAPTFKSKLQAFKDSVAYADALVGEKRKTAPLDLDGECHIVKIGKFTVNWRDPEHFANFYGAQNDTRAKLRHKYGFGKNDEDYPENDWHRNPKYGGTALRPAAKGNGGQVYTDPYEDTGIYRSIVDPNKLAVRQIINPKVKGLSSTWFFVDASGNIEYLDKDLMNFLRYNYSNTRVVADIKDEMIEMSEEEKEFAQELENLQKSELSEKTFLLENIIYMCGVIRKKGEENESFLWRNDDIVSGNFPYFSAQILEDIIDKVAMADVREVENLNESFLSKKDNKKALYESIMTSVAREVKKVLNESYDEDKE